MPILHIQGIDAEYREKRKDEEVLFANLPQEEQYFHRTEIPFTDDELVDIANKEHQYTALQKAWVDREEKRMDEGVYAMINGVLTFIPGSLYGYDNYWTLEDGKKPKYRNCTRKIFILKEFLFNHPYCLAMTRGKSRRKGATTEGTYWEWWICGRREESIGGMISYNKESIEKIFQMLFMRGFKGLLPCFVREFDSGSENFIRFIKPVERKKKGVPIKREGLNSYIDHQPTTLNSYDSGRLTYLLGDEWGKWEKVDINVYWSKVSPTLTVGTRKVGFAYIPTTVNPIDKGGAEYKIFWDDANQHAINPETGKPYGIYTPSRVVRIFDPATEGFEGCVDKFGESVIDDPIEPIMGDHGEWITEGSRTKILAKRKGLKDLRLMEARRDHPLDEYDMFAFLVGVCEFGEVRLIARLNELDENPVFLRKGRMYPQVCTKENIHDPSKKYSWREGRYMDDAAGGWLIFEMPEKPNHFNKKGSLFPLNDIRYEIGVDTVKSSFAVSGSMASICVFKKSIIEDGIEKGLYPVAYYVGKPRLMQHLWEQILLACMWYGCKATVEIDATDNYYDYFVEMDAHNFLHWTPRVAIDVTKKIQHIKPGVESANPFQHAMQLEVAKKYIDGTLVDGYNGNVHRIVFPQLIRQLLEYNHAERTKSDLVIALMMSLLPCFGATDMVNRQAQKPRQLLPTYKITMPN